MKLSSLLVVLIFYKDSRHLRNLWVNYRYCACRIQNRFYVVTRSTVETPWLCVFNQTNGKSIKQTNEIITKNKNKQTITTKTKQKQTNKQITECVCESVKERSREGDVCWFNALWKRHKGRQTQSKTICRWFRRYLRNAMGCRRRNFLKVLQSTT